MIPATMRVARLHAVGDVRVCTVPVPEPGPDELLVRVEACGVCPTDARKWAIGVDDGEYPFNPGHEWLGRVAALGAAVTGWEVGQLAYGDTYAGYAEYALISTRPAGWSAGAIPLPDDVPPERAIFVEPLADCLHAVRDQAAVREGERVVVLGAGSMGLQLVAAAAQAGAQVLAVEPRADRRALAERFGAAAAASDGWAAAARDWSGGTGPDVVVVSVGQGALAAAALKACAPGGRVVLFAGFGDEGEATIDLNLVHYRELTLIGSEWVGTPPRQRLVRYQDARRLLASGALALEELVTDRCDLDGVAAALRAVRQQRTLKTVLLPCP